MEDKIKITVMEEAKKRGIFVEQEESNSNDNDFVEMISLLFHSRTQIHTLHLQTESYAEHVALQGYYDGIGDLIDTIVETYQGKYGIIKGYKSYPIVEYKSTESTTKILKNICDKVTKLRKCCNDSWIQNEIDNVCVLLNQTIYKLRFLK
jgi:hypothetical protein